MLGKLFKKPRKEKEHQDKLPFDKKEPRKEKKPEVVGPRWAAFVLMILSVLTGLFFWVYGNLDKLKKPELKVEKRVSKEIRENEDGLIIFRKK